MCVCVCVSAVRSRLAAEGATLRLEQLGTFRGFVGVKMLLLSEEKPAVFLLCHFVVLTVIYFGNVMIVCGGT